MENLPVSCSLSPSALDARRRDLLAKLVRRASERRELPNGYQLRFAPEAGLISAVAEMVDAERQCCRFLRFSLTVEPGEGPISVDLTGPTGTREFLAAMFEDQ